MKSRIFTGELLHKRTTPVQHRFVYPVYFFAFDVDELSSLDQKISFFGYNKRNIISLFDSDYLYEGEDSIQDKVQKILDEHDIRDAVKEIFLVTNARFFGHVFNPISFFYCYGSHRNLICVIAQVNNTYGESHLYILKDFASENLKYEVITQHQKEFHVSPFFDKQGQYEFRLSAIQDEMEMQVNLMDEEGRYWLISSWGGKGKPLSRSQLLKTIICYPMSILMTLPRIHIQAFKLFFFKKLKHHSKPNPDHKMTIRYEKPTWFRKQCMRIVLGLFSKIKMGKLEVELPDGSCEIFGNDDDCKAQIKIHHYRFFSRLVLDSGIGLGEGYVVGEWDTDDPANVLNLLIKNKAELEGGNTVLSSFKDWLHNMRHKGRQNTISGSKKNIQEHYDLSNDFFKTFLDESMTYSSGVFYDEEDTLAEAQQNKLQLILEKARIDKNHHVLEIGCGWGSFAIKAVKATGCRMTCLTLSEEQHKWARERVEKEGLSDLIEIKLCDYRHIEGSFDRIVSIEMLEAVGHENLPSFFSTCDTLLKSDGLAVIQTITIPDQRYQSYLKGCDFIQKHIFPGGHLPSLEVLTKVLSKHTSFFIEDLENIGYDYAKTLRLWKEAFLKEIKAVEALGFDEMFCRKWEYYLAYCEAAFENRYLNDLHIVLTRVGNTNLNRKIHAFLDELKTKESV
jgi:cyclopropane-fatty-acyl-phospholipid synthase